MYSYGPPHMAEKKQDDQLEHTFSSYVRIRDIALKTCQRRWTIGRSGERESGISVLVARQDDDDEGHKKWWKWIRGLNVKDNFPVKERIDSSRIFEKLTRSYYTLVSSYSSHQTCGNLLSFLLRCGIRPYERGTQCQSPNMWTNLETHFYWDLQRSVTPLTLGEALSPLR